MNRDKKGPEGKGPRTGRGLGTCKKKKLLGEPVDFLGDGPKRKILRKKR